MAVLKGVEITVTVDGQKLNEHEDTRDDSESNPKPKCQHLIRRYIEAEPGKEFTVHFNAPSRAYALMPLKKKVAGLSYDITLDGSYVDGFCGKGFPHKLERTGAYRGADGHYKVWPFQFSPVVFNSVDRDVPDAILQEEKRKFQNVGLIQVNVYRCKSITLEPMSCRLTFGQELLDDQEEVHLKALIKKGNFVKTSLGHPQRVKLTHEHLCDNIDSETKPFMVFQFYYRTLKWLKKLCVVESTPEPEDRGSSNIQTMTRNEVERLAQQYLLLKNGYMPIKTEDGADRKRSRGDDDDVIAVHTRPAKRRKPEAGDVVIELE